MGESPQDMTKTQTSNLLTDQVAFDRIAYFALRSELLFDAVADVMPVAQAMPGSSVKFTIFNDLSEKTSTLTEDTDVTPVVMGDSQVLPSCHWLHEHANILSVP